MKESLRDVTVKGVTWSGIDNVVRLGVTFVVGIVLARLLSPDDYGLIGIISIFMAICQTLINGGFTTALIRKKEISEDDYNTAFIVNIGMSLLLYIIIFLCAPAIADFFGRNELINLTRVLSLSMIVGALAIVQQTRLTRKIDFRTQTKVTLIASVMGGGVGIVMALFGFGVWALVAQQLTMQGMSTCLLVFCNKWYPRFRFSSNSFHDLFGFGWKMMISALLDTIWKELYQMVVGKFYNSATLGQYTRSKQFSDLFSSNLTNVIQRVTYPVLSTIQDDKERMMFAYRRIIKLSMFITAISMFFLGAVSEPLLYCLIGPQWHDAAMFLPLICISGSTYPLHAINLNMLQVQGRSDLFLGLEIIKKIIAVGPLLIGAFVGIMPMLYVNLISTVIAYFLNSHYSGKFLGYSSWMQIKDFAPSYGASTLIALSVYFLKFLPLSFWIVLLLQITLGSIVFYVVCHRMREYKELKGLLIPVVNRLKK